MKISLFFQEITFRTEFPGSNFLLPTFLTSGKRDFEVANLLLATVNVEPCRRLFISFLTQALSAVPNDIHAYFQEFNGQKSAWTDG